MSFTYKLFPGVSRVLISKLYHAARNAKQRCINPSQKHYADYGGRGIEFKFVSIYAMVVHLFTLPGHDDLSLWIDRRDNDGHYAAGNLQFVTRSAAQKNRRRARPPSKGTLVDKLLAMGFGPIFAKLRAGGMIPDTIGHRHGVSRQTACRVLEQYALRTVVDGTADTTPPSEVPTHVNFV